MVSILSCVSDIRNNCFGDSVITVILGHPFSRLYHHYFTDTRHKFLVSVHVKTVLSCQCDVRCKPVSRLGCLVSVMSGLSQCQGCIVLFM